MNWYEILGWIATVVAVFMYAPQTIKVLKNKSAHVSKIAFIIIAFGCSIWAIFTPLQDSIQGYVTNSLIMILMTPILWYLFPKNWKLLIPMYLWMGTTILIGLSFLFFDIKVHVSLKYSFVIVAGMSTGFAMLPQTIRIIKNKKIQDYSAIAGVLISLANLMWVVYWGAKSMDSSGNDVALGILSAFFSFTGVLWQIPILIIYFKQKHK